METKTDILETNPDVMVAIICPDGEDTDHLFEYITATSVFHGRQETLYLEDLHQGQFDLRADAPQGTSK